MNSPDLLKLLSDEEHHIEKQRATALARQQWHKVELLEERLDFSRMIRGRIVELDQDVIVSAKL